MRICAAPTHNRATAESLHSRGPGSVETIICALMQCHYHDACCLRSMTDEVDIPAERMMPPEDVAEAALLPFR